MFMTFDNKKQPQKSKKLTPI